MGEDPNGSESVRFGVKGIAFLLIAWAGLACFFVSLNDGLHVFADRSGEVHSVLTTTVPDITLLLIALTSAAGVLVFLWLGEAFLFTFLSGKSYREARALLPATFLPLGILLLIPLRYFPGLTVISSVALLLSTALAQALFVLSLILIITAQLGLLRRVDKRINPALFVFAKLSDRTIGWILFGVALAILTATIPLFLEKEVFSGDQPHYLIVTHSLLEDGDFFIEDDHADRVFEGFTTVPVLPPQSLRNSHDGRTIPFHKIGLSVLAVPFYAVLGKLGAVWMIGLFAAFAVVLTFRVILLFVEDRAAALWATFWVWLSVPLLGLSHVFMTEVPLIAIALLVLYLLHKDEELKFPWAILLIAWTLPWLHTRGFAVAIGLTLLLLWKLRGTKWFWWLPGLGFVLALLVPMWNFLIYRDFSIVAQMGAAAGELDVLGIPSHLLGLIFDSAYGILLFNPAILCLIPGAFVLRRTNFRALIALSVYAAFAVGPALAYAHWWGGSTPARYLAMAMPVFGLLVAAFLADKQFKRWHGAGRVLIVLSCLLSVATIVDSSLGSTVRGDMPGLLAAISLGSLDAIEWWPSWFVGGWRFIVHCVLLLVAIRILAGVGQGIWRFFEKRESLNLTAYAASGTVLLTILLLMLLAPFFEFLTPSEPNEANPGSRQNALEFSQRFRGERYRVVDLLGGWNPAALPERGFSAIRLFGRAPLVGDPDAPRGRYYPLARGTSAVDMMPSMPLWAGDYEAHIVVAAERPYQHIYFDLLDFSTRGRDPWQPLARTEVTDGKGYVLHVVNFRLERNSAGLRWRIQSDDVAKFAYAKLIPLRYAMASESDVPPDLFEKIALRFNDYDLFVNLGEIYPPDSKWFWTRADLDTEWTILSRRNFPALLISLNSRPSVTFTAYGSQGPEILGFEVAGRQVRTRVPVATDVFGIYRRSRIRIDVDGAFVPAEEDPDSEDFRRLGTHTRIALAPESR